MKNLRFALFVLIMSVVGSEGSRVVDSSTFSPQTTTWKFSGLAVGAVDGRVKMGSLLMPDVLKLPDGSYRLFFNRSEGPGNESISHADSRDGTSWVVKGEVLRSSTDPKNKFHILGGPRVVALPDGRYRMYFCASPYHQQGAPPKYKIYSAISKDAVHFTVEDGIRINTYPDDPNSPITLAGHGAFFQARDGSYVSIFSADRKGARAPSDLFIAYSKDGLAWSGVKRLYELFHDPVVIKKGNKYYFFGMLLDKCTFMGVSSDGIHWPSFSGLKPVLFYDKNNMNISEHVGDVGAMIAPSGQIWILSNWSLERRKGSMSTAIAVFKP